jgi:hypothetical protein
MHLFHSPFQKTMSQPDDLGLDERIDDLLMVTARTMPLKPMLVPVLGHSTFTKVNSTIHRIRDFIAYLNKLLPTGAELFSKISQLAFPEEKRLAIPVNIQMLCSRSYLTDMLSVN